MSSENLILLPEEVLLHALSFLDFKDIAAFGRMNKTYNFFSEDNSLWKEQFLIHFPHLFNKLSKQENINWYEKFREADKTEYKDAKNKDIDKTLKKLCYLVKKSDR